jgi:hypothetical protein
VSERGPGDSKSAYLKARRGPKRSVGLVYYAYSVTHPPSQSFQIPPQPLRAPLVLSHSITFNLRTGVHRLRAKTLLNFS